MQTYNENKYWARSLIDITRYEIPLKRTNFDKKWIILWDHVDGVSLSWCSSPRLSHSEHSSSQTIQSTLKRALSNSESFSQLQIFLLAQKKRSKNFCGILHAIIKIQFQSCLSFSRNGIIIVSGEFKKKLQTLFLSKNGRFLTNYLLFFFPLKFSLKGKHEKKMINKSMCGLVKQS